MIGKKVALISAFIWGLVACGFGQNERIILANLKQDLELINREVTSLRSEVELLRRENAQLRVALDQIARSPKTNDQNGLLLELQNRLQVLELSQKQSTRAQGRMQEEVNQKFQQIIEQMNSGFEKVSSQKKSSSSSQTPAFSSNYPKNGFVHKVEKGETVSSIAQKYQSKVSWIIDANQIVDPTKVFVGRELFVPQK
jgi:LysM repeat protein